uniref:Uncharacterized protein n=1 Tax=Arion vulgaris TaxID=1028688 RepID=A0A0B7BL76_9EUPU
MFRYCYIVILQSSLILIIFSCKTIHNGRRLYLYIETDPEGSLQAELVGLCDLVPAYNISDLSEVLEVISRNPHISLEDVRPTKVLYYLQVWERELISVFFFSST